MNTHTECRRHSQLPPTQPTHARRTDDTASELARHSDPSLATPAGSPAAASTRMAWVRPTELTPYVAPLIGRGIDLQAELIRRARRTPVTATRAVQRSRHVPSPRTGAPVAREEGLQL